MRLHVVPVRNSRRRTHDLVARCTGMLSGFTRDGSGTSVQTWVCKSSSDADAFKALVMAAVAQNAK